LLQAPVDGSDARVVHLDSNAQEAHRFDNIVRALAQRFDRRHWQVVVNDDYVHDQRLVGGPMQLPPLSRRLPLSC
jgi:dTDP-4-dehydrorhamnose reductase